MDTETMTPNEIRRAGMDALRKAPGPVGAVRFLQQFDRGIGDYTAEREKWLDTLDLETVFKGIEEMRKDK